MFPSGSETRPRHGAPMPEDSNMKTVNAPDTLAALLDSTRDTLAAMGPAAALFVALIGAAVVASAVTRSRPRGL